MRNSVIRLLTALLALTALFTVSLSAQSEGDPNEAPGADIVRYLTSRLNAGDVDSAMNFIAEDAYFGTLDMDEGHYAGKDAIRTLFEGLVADNFRIEIDLIGVYGDGHVLISNTQTWSDSMPPGLAPLNATEIYVIDGDQITGITWVLTEESLERMMAVFTPPLDADELLGIWRKQFGSILEFRADGTYRIDGRLEGDLNEALPRDSGTYTIDGYTVTWISGDDTRYCEPGDTQIVDIIIRDDGMMDLTARRWDCEATSPDIGVTQELRQISGAPIE